MELRELKSFCTVARLRNMSKAAEQLLLGQPTVSTHIKKLEEELGILLFDRGRRPLRLTREGEKLAELAEPLLDGIEALVSTTSVAEEEGPVSIASTYDIIPHVLLRVVRAFRSVYPAIHLRIRSEHRDEVLRMVADREADIGMVPGPERAPQFDFQGLFSYERVLITPLGHPLLDQPIESLSQISQWPLILMSRRTYTRTMLEGEFRRLGLPYEIVMELDSMDIIKRYVALGLGISVGPKLAIEPEDRDEIGVVDLSHLLAVEQAGVVTLRGRKLSTSAQNFIAFAQRTLSDRSAA